MKALFPLVTQSVGHVYRKRGVTRRVKFRMSSRYVCLDTFRDGTSRFVWPTEWQLHRWLSGAVKADAEAAQEGTP